MPMKLNVLKAVWNTQEGYVFVPVRKKADAVHAQRWDEGKAYKYPEEWDAITKRLQSAEADGWDTYWCPTVFHTPKRLKENVLPEQGLLWADLDEVDPRKLGNLKPSIAWASSDNRYQGLWSLDKKYDIETVESTNRDLTYHIGADKGGWDVTQVLRVPGSKNFKYDPPQQGKFMWAEKLTYQFDKLQETVKNETEPVSEVVSDAVSRVLSEWASLPARTRDLLLVDPEEVEVGDRSDRLWEIETSLIEAGVPIEDIVEVVKASPWNKFKGRRNEDNQIYHEVLKADKHVKTRVEAEKKGEVINVAEAMESEEWAVPFETFMSQHIEPPEWLVEGIWQSGTYGMIAGEPKTYKSVQATDLALSVASGRPYAGRFPVRKTGAVIYVQEENNPQTVQDRLFKIAYAKGLITSTPLGWALSQDVPLYLSNNYGVNLTEQSSRELIERTIESIRPVLMIFDPLYMMLGQVDENSAKEVGDVLRWLTSLRNRYGVAILICHHYNKGGVNSRGGQRVRGSSAFHAWVESALYIKASAELFTVKVEREFRAYPSMDELVFKVEMGAPGEMLYRVNVEDTPDNMPTNVKREDIISLLAVSHRTLEELKTLSKLSRSECMETIRSLELDGIIKKEPAVRGSKATYALAVDKFKGGESNGTE